MVNWGYKKLNFIVETTLLVEVVHGSRKNVGKHKTKTIKLVPPEWLWCNKQNA